MRKPRTLELMRRPGCVMVRLGNYSPQHIILDTPGPQAVLNLRDAKRLQDVLDKHIAYLQSKNAKRRKA